MGACLTSKISPADSLQIYLDSYDILCQLSSVKELFDLHEILGKGRTSCVKKVTKKADNKVYVVKQVFCNPKNYCQNFLNEIKFLSSNTHENIIKLEGGYYDNHSYYICVDYCTGGRLLDRIRADGHFAETSASNIIKSVLNATKFCHDQDIVHRDLKLENIMFDKEGDDGKVIVIDWGQSMMINKDQVYTKKCIGTLHYMGPECVRNRESWELKKSDMFAIGIITFCLLIGHFPFAINDVHDVKNQVKSNILWYNSEISSHAKNFIESLIDEDTHERFDVDQALNHPWILQQN